MREFETLAEAYCDGLQLLLDRGDSVPSVLDSYSKASGFGRGDRPYREIIGDAFRVNDPRSALIATDVMPAHLGYCFGLLAWSLDGRNDVSSLGYYRKGAAEYSDDEHTLSGAFGHRMFAAGGGDQLGAILARIEQDPSHRRTFATILSAADNFKQSREYPCAVGVQVFLRRGALTWLTVMRAQQALTVLPYDAFLFMSMHQLAASMLDAELGPYLHQSGTYHVYDDELAAVAELVRAKSRPVALPAVPAGRQAATELVRDLVRLEAELRDAATRGDHAAVAAIAADDCSQPYLDVARACLTTQAFRRLGDATTVIHSSHESAELAAMIAAIR